jgi:hypothetical protein
MSNVICTVKPDRINLVDQTNGDLVAALDNNGIYGVNLVSTHLRVQPTATTIDLTTVAPNKSIRILPDWEFSNPVSYVKEVTIEDDTDSSSTITGSIVTAGGIGVSKNLIVGGKIDVSDTTASTLRTNGAVHIVGGLGVERAINTDKIWCHNVADVGHHDGASIHTAGGLEVLQKAYVADTLDASTYNGGLLNTEGAITTAGGLHTNKNIFAEGDVCSANFVIAKGLVEAGQGVDMDCHYGNNPVGTGIPYFKMNMNPTLGNKYEFNIGTDTTTSPGNYGILMETYDTGGNPQDASIKMRSTNKIYLDATDQLYLKGNGMNLENPTPGFGFTVRSNEQMILEPTTTLTLKGTPNIILDDDTQVNGNLTVTGELINKDVLVTGLLSGGIVTVNVDTTKFDVSGGVGYVVDRSFSPPQKTRYTWNAFTAVTPTYLTTYSGSWLAIEFPGGVPTIFQSTDVMNGLERRTKIQIGRLAHFNKTTINAAFYLPIFTYDMNSDILTAFNVIYGCYGAIISANGGLTLAISQGNFLRQGGNSLTAGVSDSCVYNAGYTPMSFYRVSRTGASDINLGALVTTIDPSQYDDGSGVMAGVPVGNFQSMLVILFPYNNSMTCFVMYGQKTYATFAAARSDLTRDVEIRPAARYGLERATIIVQEGVVDLVAAIAAGDAAIIHYSRIGRI